MSKVFSSKGVMRVYSQFDSFPNTCGVGCEYEFTRTASSDNWNPTGGLGTKFGGIGYNVAGFIHTAVCHDAYEEIKRKCDIVYQSPVKYNSNSGNQFFFIVYKKKDRPARLEINKR